MGSIERHNTLTDNSRIGLIPTPILPPFGFFHKVEPLALYMGGRSNAPRAADAAGGLRAPASVSTGRVPGPERWHLSDTGQFESWLGNRFNWTQTLRNC
jgi:hypothetical protein